MSKEVVFIYDTPNVSYKHVSDTHNLDFYLNFFDRIRVLYWSKEGREKPFKKGRIVFYPYPRPYNSGYVTGLKYMAWIFRTLWTISRGGERMVFVPVIPVWAGLPSLLVGRLKGKKVVLRLGAHKMRCVRLEDETLGVPRLVTEMKIFILKTIYHLTVPFYDWVVVISEGIEKHISQYGARRTSVVPIRIDTERFKPRKRKKKGNVVLAVGQIKKRKGFGEVIEALGSIKEEGLYPRLIIVGGATNPRDRRFLKEFKRKASENDLDVEFRGHLSQDELAEVYNEADIFVHASHAETLGMVIMEAMLSGLPVVATRTDGGRYLVEDGENGFLVPTRSPEKIKEKIKILLEDPELRNEMGRRAEERIRQLMKEAEEENKRLWTKIFENEKIS